MFKTLKYAAVALALTATSTLAASAPWTRAAPGDLTVEHQREAQAARGVQAQLAPGQFGKNPLDVKWDDRYLTQPMSNMTQAALGSALTGKYHVYRKYGQSAWSVRYYGTDGVTYFCEPNNSGSKYREFSMDRYVEKTPWGLAGVMHWDAKTERSATPPASEQWGWPVVANSSTGEVTMYVWYRGDWHQEPGWIQSDYAAGFAQECPSLPRTSSVNNAQAGAGFADIARNAHGFRGFKTAFPNNPRNPLTAGMYYHLYNPTQQ